MPVNINWIQTQSVPLGLLEDKIKDWVVNEEN